MTGLRPMFTEDHPVRIKLVQDHGIRFVRFLGRGGEREAWHVVQHEAPLALKISILPMDDTGQKVVEELEIAKTDGVYKDPFIVKFCGRLPSDHLVTCWELGDETLLDVLQRTMDAGRPGLSWSELLDDRTDPGGYMLQAARALYRFGGLGHLHRDIKPENLMMFGPYVKLADLGLARRVSQTTHRSMHLAGTYGYAAPESERGEYTALSDLYSAAATYLKLRTGHEPFGNGLDPWEWLARQKAGDPDVSGLEDFEIGPIRHALAPNRKDRPQDGLVAFFQSIRPGAKQTWFVPPAVMPAPNQVEVKQFDVPEIDIQAEQVRVVSGDSRGLPAVPAEILAAVGQRQGLEQAIAQLEAEDHPSLRPAQAAIGNARRQLEELEADREANDIRLPKQIKAEIQRRLETNLHESPSVLCQLARDVSAREMLLYVLRVRNVVHAKQNLDGAERKYRRELAAQLSKLKAEQESLRVDLERRQGEDLEAVLRIVFHELSNPALFPIEQWLELEPLLANRYYPWDEHGLLERAEQIHRGQPLPLASYRLGGLEWAEIPAGEFLMGSPAGEAGRSDDEHQHRVRITRRYYLSVYPVTVGQFKVFVEATGYRTEGEADGKGAYGYLGGTWQQKSEITWRSPGFQQDDSHPVVCTSWNDAQAYCKWLSEQTGQHCRLPTEAEREYACRGGAKAYALYGIGDGKNLTHELANFGQKRNGTTPVGHYGVANGFGLFDMHGNVWEWCQDRYGEDYYKKSPVDDPQGPETGEHRVSRGGGWCSGAGGCRSANRGRGGPAYRSNDLGFRVAAVPPG